MAQSMHDVSDPRNASVLINVNGDLKPRAEAVVSVFDSGFMLGDGVWEGLRVQNGKLAFLDRHLDRLFEGAKALAMDIGLSREALTKRLYDTLAANGMRDGVHVRLMVTRGVRSTPYQDPRVVVGGATVVIIPEYKEPDPAVYERGLKLFTVHVRRGDPAVQDQKINSHSKLNCILASIQATQAGADEALMLDPHGFVATCNSTHFFIVRKGEVWTSSGKYCLGGITRGLVLEIAREAGIPAIEKDFSLTDVYGADEAFVTGTFAGIVPVREIDGRALTCRGPMVERLQKLYADRVERDVASRAAVTTRIAMWSGPRNLSTAMMRSFGSRADTFVSDEPFYGCFLKTTGADHPMREEVIAAMDCDWRSVMAALRGNAARRLAGLVPEAHVAPHGRADRLRRFRRFHPCLPDPRARADDRFLSAQARSGGVRGFRDGSPGRILRARGRPPRPCAAGDRRQRRARRS